MAQWRFQCLKQKCILIDREIRLEANNIPFECRSTVAVDETVHVSVDDWQEKIKPCEFVVAVDEESDEEGEKAATPEVSSVTDPDVEVSIMKLPGEEGYNQVDQMLLEIKAEPSSSPEVTAAEEIGTAATFPREGGEKPPLKAEDSEEVLFVAAAVGQDSVIDLCATIDQANVKRELMDASLDVSLADLSGLATRKASTGAAVPSSSGPINFDFLLDSPSTNKPQRHPSTAITPMMRKGTRSPPPDSEDKENDEGRMKRSTVTKLNYKPISKGRKSILVKRVGLAENQQKNVHFATDVKEREEEWKKDAAKEEVAKEANPNDRPKKKMTVNIRTIHSRPPRTVPKEGT